MATAEVGQEVTRGGNPALRAVVGKLRSTVGLVMKTNTGRIGAIIVAVHLFLAIFGPFVVPYDPILLR